MQKCTEAVAAWLIRCQVIEEQEKELYCYAVESFMLLGSPMMIALLLGVVMGNIKESILVVIPFMMIRKFSGGYHAKNLWICLICSSLLLFLCILAACRISANIIFTIVTLIACLSLIICSPIEHGNRTLDLQEKTIYRKVTCIFTGVFLGAVQILKYTGFECESVCISMGILLTAGLQLPCIVKRIIKD